MPSQRLPWISRSPLGLLALVAFTGAHSPPSGQGLEDAVRASLGLERFELQLVETPAALPAACRIEVGFEGRRSTLVLERTSVRAAEHEVAVLEPGTRKTVAAPPIATYRGHVAGAAERLVAASLLADGLHAAVLEPGGSAWFVQPLARVAPDADPRWHVVYRQSASPFDSSACGSELLPAAPRLPLHAPRRASEGNDCLQVAELAFDADVEYFLANGSSVPATVQAIEAVLNAVNLIYARDVLIEHRITTIIVRTSEPDPYTQSDPGMLLDQFRNHWNADQGGVVRDVAHFVTGRDMNGNIIGLAWVGVVCNLPWAYGLSQFTFDFGTHVTILGHELGHNWNAPHCLDEPCVLMCGGCHEFGPITQQVILDYRDGVGCLDPGPGSPQAVPPNAREDAAPAKGELVLDVLENDFDGNCDVVVIDGHDLVSAEGGTIERSVGSGPNGRDELRYTPPAGYSGPDSFEYTAGDGTGLQDAASVALTVFDPKPDVVAHYRFDETSGNVALDSSGAGHHGIYQAAPQKGIPGARPGTGTAVTFDGQQDHVLVFSSAGLDPLRSYVSVAAWILPRTNTGLKRIFGNDGSWSFGQVDQGLYFRVEGVQDYMHFFPLPVNTWTHVAVVFDENDDATFFANGELLVTMEGNAPANDATAPWRIATLGSDGFFDGTLDDLQVYDAALTPQQVRYLYDHPGGTVDGTCGFDYVSYCTPKLNSCFSLPRIAGEGIPSASASSGFVVRATNTKAQKSGLLLYTDAGRAAVPYQGGTLCIQPQPVRRTPSTVDTTGTLNFCDGVLEIDMNAFAAGQLGGNPLPELSLPGTQINCQFWGRDNATTGSLLSDGLEYTVCP